MKGSGFCNGEPRIVEDSASWSVVFKPHGMATAPLREEERTTLLAWYLALVPGAAGVIGKKSIERGLVHRLDTPTEGLVLIAKTQKAYDSFQEAQNADQIRKTYRALCDLDEEAETRLMIDNLPFSIESRFRSWGPGGREVRPVFPDDRRFDGSGRDYQTIVEAIDLSLPGKALCRCSLSRGYRHQVRAHLASRHMPIQGDSLYNKRYVPGDTAIEVLTVLALSAVGITFPDPDTRSSITISLP